MGPPHRRTAAGLGPGPGLSPGAYLTSVPRVLPVFIVEHLCVPSIRAGCRAGLGGEGPQAQSAEASPGRWCLTSGRNVPQLALGDCRGRGVAAPVLPPGGPPRPVSCQIRCPRTVGGPGASSRGRDVLAPLPAGQPALGECERISGAQGALKPGGGGALSITHPQTGCDSSCVWLPPRGTRRAGWGHLVSFIGQMSGTQTWHPNRGLSSDPGSATYSLCDLHNLPEPQLPHL